MQLKREGHQQVQGIKRKNQVRVLLNFVRAFTTHQLVPPRGMVNRVGFDVNILGEKIKKSSKNQIVFDIYSNGSVVKSFNR